MTKSLLQLFLVALTFVGVSCSAPHKRLVSVSPTASPSVSGRSASIGGTRISSVKTTAYTSTESDHLAFGAKTAVGTPLKYGRVRSAAADWSVYPVGTVFQIEGEPYLYEVDDYGSALVGTNTIDLYKPDANKMNQWGSRRVNIRVVKWGSFSRSLSIMRNRVAGASKPTYLKRMVERIQKSMARRAS